MLDYCILKITIRDCSCTTLAFFWLFMGEESMNFSLTASFFCSDLRKIVLCFLAIVYFSGKIVAFKALMWMKFKFGGF